MNKGLLLGIPAFLLVMLALTLVPVRHAAWLEGSADNPVQRIGLCSRSCLGLARPAWGARIEGVTAWGDSRQGFFLAPTHPARVTLRAWPRFSRGFEVQPIQAASAGPLQDKGAREAFRTWFVAILEQQLNRPSPAWEEAQRDCAGLLRFAFREAWGPHSAAWRDRVGFAGLPVARDPEASLAGPWRQAFPTPEGWQPFARGALLRDYACVSLGRDLAQARPGDLLFFCRAGAQSQPDHAMAFVRPDRDGQPMLIYHTGPERSPHPKGALPPEGEVRRVRVDELLQHPDPVFRPRPENPAFLGVFRWRVLMDYPES